ncbi:hypothetical protein Ae406Ps2_6104c [Pseudonocardia sp. Ae406_Ps2]|nr:hypothetical protein Ae331Ps2_6066 [Pseudonocardia sp. Ae331_Ps2]OLL96268.1 hypothetical protein Ae406Ps2_6104c [Pseudonocardia sp. Ae406_Ps2]
MQDHLLSGVLVGASTKYWPRAAFPSRYRPDPGPPPVAVGRDSPAPRGPPRRGRALARPV